MRKKFGEITLVLILALSLVSAITIINEDKPGPNTIPITGEVTHATLGASLFLSGIPSLNILHPENKTYLKQRLLINYTTQGGATTEYSVDGGVNNSITQPINYTFNEGLRHLQMWANNSNGMNWKEIYFTINLSLLKINYTDYNGSTRGTSTDFYNYAYEDLLAMDDIILENTNYGKIHFNETINVEDDLDNTDGEVEINANIIITNETVTLNSTALPNFNTSAEISLYGLSYTTPEILLNGNPCPSEICTQISYSAGTLVFTVTHFTALCFHIYLCPLQTKL